MRLENKVALLTGVGSGMGRATAILFAQEGASIVVNARSLNHLGGIVSDIDSMGGNSTAVSGDVSVKTEADRVVAKVIELHGHIDVVYCGTGGNFDHTRDFSTIDTEFHQQTIENSITTLYNLTQSVRPLMKARGGGSIISVAASFTVRQEGNSSYGAAKGGVIGLSMNLARELYGDDIRVNVLLPGLFRGKLKDTKVTPAPNTLNRTGYPQDIAYAALYLASDEASWITGQTLGVDGGVDVGTRPLWEFERH